MIILDKSPEVGIWWYTDKGDILKRAVPMTQGVLVHDYIQFSRYDSHVNLWSDVVKEYIPDNFKKALERIHMGHKSYERGRVIFNYITSWYEITCSEQMLSNFFFRERVVRAFHLENERHKFCSLPSYKVEIS